MALRLAVAAAITAVLMCVACGALLVTTLPPLVSLVVEPLSLLLMPGVMVSIAVAKTHDLVPMVALEISAGFYFVLISMLLLRRPVARGRAL